MKEPSSAVAGPGPEPSTTRTSNLTGREKRAPRPPYPAPFPKEAVALVQHGKGTLPQIARELGVHQETLRLWVKQAQIDAGQRPGVTTDGQAEIARLREENARLRAERDLLKEATAFFVRESAPR